MPHAHVPKPAHLGPAYAAQFQDQSVADAYGYRPPYTDDVFDILAGLMVEPRVVLDVGCGRGEVARRLLPHAARVDAIDPSSAMLAAGKRLPGGGDPRLRWVCAPAETAPLDGPYGLITAGSSLHWMDWDVVIPRFHGALAPGAVLATLDAETAPVPWADALGRLITRYSTNREFRPYDLLDELTARRLFVPLGARRVPPHALNQSVAAYVESFHARNGFSRERMPREDARAFDEAAGALVRSHCLHGVVRLHLTTTVHWGLPIPGLTTRGTPGATVQ